MGIFEPQRCHKHGSHSGLLGVLRNAHNTGLNKSHLVIVAETNELNSSVAFAFRLSRLHRER